MLVLMAWMVAQAASPGYYHPPDIAGSSKLYTTTAAQAGAAFSERQEQLDTVATALADYRVALDLLGDRATSAERERLTGLERKFNRERAVFSAFANTLMEDFNQEFTSAMERAAPAGSVQCQPRIAEGRALPGMPSRTKANPDCTGKSHSADIATRIDEDPALQSALGEIGALQWPAITLPSEPQAPIGDSATWVSASAFFRKAAGPSLNRIEQQDSDARLEFGAAIEQEATKEELEAMLVKARQITSATAQKRAAIAAPTLDAVDVWSARQIKRDGQGVSWCANPVALGGCTGTDGTRDPGKLLLVDKKINKTLP